MAFVDPKPTPEGGRKLDYAGPPDEQTVRENFAALATKMSPSDALKCVKANKQVDARV